VKRFLYVVGALAMAFTLAAAGTADAKAQIKFKMPKRLDTFQVKAFGVPVSPVDPSNDSISFLLGNLQGVVYYETFDPGMLVPNKKNTVCKDKLKKAGSDMIYKFFIKEKRNRQTGELEYHFKVKGEADLWQTDPNRNTIYLEHELANMTVQLAVGDDVFFINADWERKGNRVIKGWKLDADELFPPSPPTT
jgi:hypothetical protein